MNQLSVVILHLILVLQLLLHVEADTTDRSEYPLPKHLNAQLNLVVVIGMLSIICVSVVTFLLLSYIKFCYRSESADRNPPQSDTGLISASNRFSGVEKSVIESLPFFRFSSLKGSKEGLECAVCLSKFEDVEVLRLLPKCKHAFHINCIDHWLEKHSSCPLCRHKVSTEDLTPTGDSNSARFLSNNQSEMREDSNNIELFVQREESQRGSSRFSIGSSFRKIHEKGGHRKEEKLLIQKVFHKHNHKVTVSNFHFNNRWSNLNSSDLMFLNSEMLNDISSDRFSSTNWNNVIDMSSTGKDLENKEIMKKKEEMEIKRSLHSKVGLTSTSVSSSTTNSGECRSVSEIISLSRYGNFGMKNKITESCSMFENDLKEGKARRVWLPIARRTIHWLANREKSSQEQSLNV
ncbi:hypothetical protein TIFTF001_019753 [Ficus carica]|uniref:RING-type E3 ubiquitin transferase n=1 Tax=Ficus carica TaxID=3494 RepID=A0AA88DJG8_FICCA|nr:hypothetical protein TIFTF001_019753 [Ficus carica]